MKLQTKSILFFDALLLIVCVLLGILGYYSANKCFEIALEEKADSDMRQAWALLDTYYPGSWHLRGSGLYKGGKKMTGAFDVVDHLSRLNGNNVTIFEGDTRVATTFLRDGSAAENAEAPLAILSADAGNDSFDNRSVGTKASPEVVAKVLIDGENFRGEAVVLGEKYFCAYAPIKDMSGKNIGMLFMGIPKGKVESLQSSFISSTLVLTLILAALIACLMSLWLRRSIAGPIERLKSSAESFARRCQGKKDLSQLYFEDPDIHTRDELEDLSGALSSMCNEMQAYTEELIVADREVNNLKEKIVKMDTLVYQDALTGAGNKAAYENIVSHIDWEILTNKAEFAIIMADMNYLKRINDTFGHERGNYYIIKMCAMLKEAFPHSPVFRIGGDEFVVLAQDEDYAACAQTIADLKAQLAALREAHDLEPWERVSAAIGVAVYDAKAHKSVTDVFNEADEKMYADKKAMKAGRE